MAEQKATAGYIDISEIPVSTRTRKYPYQEWAAIPPGKALEVTELLDGRKPSYVYQALVDYFRRHELGLVCMVRNGHVWVARPEAAP